MGVITDDAQCGLLFVADLLKDSKTEIHIVELPPKITRLDKEKVLTEKEIVDLANKWELLKSENSLLRVIRNGSVISARI